MAKLLKAFGFSANEETHLGQSGIQVLQAEPQSTKQPPSFPPKETRPMDSITSWTGCCPPGFSPSCTKQGVGLDDHLGPQLNGSVTILPPEFSCLNTFSTCHFYLLLPGSAERASGDQLGPGRNRGAR